MVRSNYDLRQSARALCALSSTNGRPQWLVASSSVRENGVLCALEPQGYDVKAVGTWRLPVKGCAALCCGPDPGISAALHVDETSRLQLHVWRLQDGADSAAACEVPNSAEQCCLAWSAEPQSNLLSCSSSEAHVWAMADGGVLVSIVLAAVWCHALQAGGRRAFRDCTLSCKPVEP